MGAVGVCPKTGDAGLVALINIQTLYKMESTYYIINHTRKEICFFDEENSIIHILEDAINSHISWEDTDDIRIQCEVGRPIKFATYIREQGYKYVIGELDNLPFNF
jgi:hypothetical protein